jgi:hypothetical protein
MLPGANIGVKNLAEELVSRNRHSSQSIDDRVYSKELRTINARITSPPLAICLKLGPRSAAEAEITNEAEDHRRQ